MSAERNLIKTPYYSPWFSSSSTASTHNDGRLLALLPLALDQLGEGVGAGGGVVATGLVREAPTDARCSHKAQLLAVLSLRAKTPAFHVCTTTHKQKSQKDTHICMSYM